MTATYDRPRTFQTPPGSPRVRLAHLAHAAALEVPGVVALRSGPSRSFATAGDGKQVAGVRCVAAGSGSYDISLCVCCELVPLLVLGDAVRVSVTRAASAAGVAVAVVDVLVSDVVESGWAR